MQQLLKACHWILDRHLYVDSPSEFQFNLLALNIFTRFWLSVQIRINFESAARWQDARQCKGWPPPSWGLGEGDLQEGSHPHPELPLRPLRLQWWAKFSIGILKSQRFQENRNVSPGSTRLFIHFSMPNHTHIYILNSAFELLNVCVKAKQAWGSPILIGFFFLTCLK